MSVMEASSNASDAPVCPDPEHPLVSLSSLPWSSGLIGAGLMLIVLVTLVGNILVILSVVTHKPLHNAQNYLIVSMAVTDLLVAVVVMPLHIVKYLAGGVWRWGRVLCNLWLTSDVLLCTASIFHLSVIALDRYCAIRYAMKYNRWRTARLAYASIVAVFGLSGVISVLPLVGWRSPATCPHECALTEEVSYVIFSATLSFYLPAVIMCGLYLRVFLAMRQRQRERISKSALHQMLARQPLTHSAWHRQLRDLLRGWRSGGRASNTSRNEDSAGNKRHSHETVMVVESALPGNNALSAAVQEKERLAAARERRVARTLGIIISVFVLCWLPFFLLYLLMPVCESCRDALRPRWELLAVWLGYLNSMLNPVIYTVFNRDFRQAFRQLTAGACQCVWRRCCSPLWNCCFGRITHILAPGTITD